MKIYLHSMITPLLFFATISLSGDDISTKPLWDYKAHALTDPNIGLFFCIPDDWLILRQTLRKNGGQCSVEFHIPGFKTVTPTLYYRIFSAKSLGPANGEDQWLIEQTKEKMEARRKLKPDYSNRPQSIVRLTINDKHALTWIADYTSAGQKWSEYFARIVTHKATVMFFVNAPSSDIEKLRPVFDSVAKKTVVDG